MDTLNLTWAIYRRYGGQIHWVKRKPATGDGLRSCSGILPLDSVLGERFKLTKLLAVTGISSVYLAIDSRTGREVVVKVMNKSDSYYLLSFEKRVFNKKIDGFHRLLASGDRPMPYVVMTKIPGMSLGQYMGIVSIGVWQALDITYQLLQQLEKLHLTNVIHRDIKPENVMVNYKGAVQLFDFDCVGYPGNSCPCPVGTPEYRPPEQITASAVFPYSDLYSLGIMFFELLSGKNPLRRDLKSEQNRVQCETPLPLLGREVLARRLEGINDVQGKILDDAIDLINKIIQKLTAKNSSDRYQSAEAARVDLVVVMELWEYLAPSEKCWPRVEGGPGEIGRVSESLLVGGVDIGKYNYDFARALQVDHKID